MKVGRGASCKSALMRKCEVTCAPGEWGGGFHEESAKAKTHDEFCRCLSSFPALQNAPC